jgi:hypothetical protein
VKRWQWGDVALHQTAAGMIETKRKFRRIVGYADVALAVERELHCYAIQEVTASLS